MRLRNRLHSKRGSRRVCLVDGRAREADVVIVGGGSAGCVLAAKLSESRDLKVMLVEAGPDYGPFAHNAWPADLLDANFDATSGHDWGFAGETRSARARVIGGCSSHNGCAVVWPSPGDIDEWAAAGNTGWTYENLRPWLAAAAGSLRTRPTQYGQLDPFRRAFYDAACEIGAPVLDNFNDADAFDGIGLIPVNAVGSLRWNAAFAYLDPARTRPNLTILADVLVDRVLIRNGAAYGVRAVSGGERVDIRADAIVLAAGAYCSPAILHRSGIGPAAMLRGIGIHCVADRPGVGNGLANHVYGMMTFGPNDAFRKAARSHFAQPASTGHTMIKTRLHGGRPSSWDMMIGPSTSPVTDIRGRPTSIASIGLIGVVSKPCSSGRVSITSPDPRVLPRLEPGFLSDEGGRDEHVLRESMRLARRLADASALKGWLTTEPAVEVGPDFPAGRRPSPSLGEAHPASSCRMGPANDAAAVVDASGQVYELAGLYVVDASILPTIPAANIHLTVLAVAERMAEGIRRGLERVQALSPSA
jgi:choline dehydrogenase